MMGVIVLQSVTQLNGYYGGKLLAVVRFILKGQGGWGIILPDKFVCVVIYNIE